MSLLDKIFKSPRDNLLGIRAPEFPGGLAWFNTQIPPTISGLRKENRAVLIDFWTYSCVNCIRTLPHLTTWHSTYSSLGLTIIGVHTPEFAFEKDNTNIGRAIQTFRIDYPVVSDSEQKIWRLYANNVWPRKLLVDTRGSIRYDHKGEGSYYETESAIRALLTQITPGIMLPPPVETETSPDSRPDEEGVCYPTTPELYTGSVRGNVGNSGGFAANQTYEYTDTGSYRTNNIYLQGIWKSTAESLEYAGITQNVSDYLLLQFSASEVNAVCASTNGKPLTVNLLLDDIPIGQDDAGEDVTFTKDGESIVNISEPRMYRIIKSTEHLLHKKLKIVPRSANFAIYAFTFGSKCD